MRMYKGMLIASLLAFGAVSGASAAPFTVTASFTAGGQPVFTPALLPPPGMAVHPGDTITFTNPNAGSHNAHSADPSFSFKCGDGNSCTTGGVSNTWTSASVTVPESAVGHTITYICDLHGFFDEVGGVSGMFGTITVTAQTTPVELQAFDVF